MHTTLNLGSLRADDAQVVEGEVISRKLTKSMENLPTLAEALTDLKQSISLFKPQDRKVPLRAVAMTAKGGLYNVHKGPAAKENALHYTRTALTHLLSYVDDKPSNLVGVLSYLYPEARATAFNDIMRRAADRAVVMRMANLGTQAVVRAVVSESHSQESGDDLALADRLSELVTRSPQLASGRARVVKTWDRTDIEVFFPGALKEVRKGDAVAAKLWVRNSETKHGSLEISGGLLRLVCLNGMTRPVNTTESRMRHVGNVSSRVSGALVASISGVDEFTRAFEQSFELPFVGSTRAEALERVGKQYALPERTLEAAVTLWDADGVQSAGNSLAGLVNALTRASQGEGFELAEKIEKAAGELVMPN